MIAEDQLFALLSNRLGEVYLDIVLVKHLFGLESIVLADLAAFSQVDFLEDKEVV